MSCLYSDSGNGHSTRIGTALDGHGIYGSNIEGGQPPDDLDVCGGRRGVTPDSNGEEVYYYVVTEEAPFTVGCFGPVASVEECRALEPNCGNDDRYHVETRWGAGEYDLDCPCFDEFGSNIPGQGRPGYLEPLPARGGGAAGVRAPMAGAEQEEGGEEEGDTTPGSVMGSVEVLLVGGAALGVGVLAMAVVKWRSVRGKRALTSLSLKNRLQNKQYEKIQQEDQAEATL
jgi:hypothetical protein